MRMSRLCSILAAVIGIVAPLSLSESVQSRLPDRRSPEQTGEHYFTVKDSIEMVRFNRDLRSAESKVSFSPNGEYFATVTSRGIIQSDEIESTLWIFRSELVKKFLVSRGDAEGPVPMAIAKFAALPSVDYVASYEPVIR
jgi:hypothetical protein